MSAPELPGVVYTVWLADLSESLDGSRLDCGAPIVPGDFILWRCLDGRPSVPIGAYATELDANVIADDLNGYGASCYV